MENTPNADDLTPDEMTWLRLVVQRNFIGRGALPAMRRARLVELGLVEDSMGRLAPTAAGRIWAKR